MATERNANYSTKPDRRRTESKRIDYVRNGGAHQASDEDASLFIDMNNSIKKETKKKLFQSRTESGAVSWYDTMKEAQEAAGKNEKIWMISYVSEQGHKIKMTRNVYGEWKAG